MNNQGKAVFAAVLAVMLSACARSTQGSLPEIHAIASEVNLDEEDGANFYQNTLDHPDSRYYRINDYYNMKSSGGLHILPKFATYQQTSEYSCGCTAGLMVLNYYGNKDYDEAKICELAGTTPTGGTSTEGLNEFFEGIGYKTEMHAETKKKYEDIEACLEFLISSIDQGIPVLVDWEDWIGHWQVIIGIDTMETEAPYDDVLIMADPYDITDHYQDGYYIVPYGRFFDMWREGPCTDQLIPYVQAYLRVFPNGE